ncbi:MAG: aminoglycoside phosphotransferase family protein [Pararhizobium sp.]
MTDAKLFDEFLIENGLRSVAETADYRPLTGGVSSDIYRVDLPGRSLCIKRALAKLKVAADWQAPVSRSSFEWGWISFVAKRFPNYAPTPLAHDPLSGVFAMSFLSADDHPLWKAQLLMGQVDIAIAAAVGRATARIHAASTLEPALPALFDSGDNFHALRLEPYLLATARAHPEIEPQLRRLADRTAATRLALVHGDVSPKNILLGPEGPVFLDAECAWFGDPAFDLAFCLNHLLLKRIAIPAKAAELRAAFVAFSTAYLRGVSWESRDAIEARAAALLPGLFLARVDGKSPVEYITRDDQRESVRACALPLIRNPVMRLEEVADSWFMESSPTG